MVIWLEVPFLLFFYHIIPSLVTCNYQSIAKFRK